MSHTIEHSALTDSDGLHEPKGVGALTSGATDSGKVYVADGAGSGTWQNPEGTDIASTGEAAGTKFLREDGDGTCSWQAASTEGTNILSTGENKGRVAVADGSNGASWQEELWKDLEGRPVYLDTGGTAPTLATFRGGACRRLFFGAADEMDWDFHIPHDYAPGTDLYIHVHWGHNGTAISGNMVWTLSCSYAKGHDQANFSAEIAPTITYATTDLATTPQYRHRLDEIQLSAASPSASQLDSDDIEPDGIICVNLTATTIPTITGGSTNEPFLVACDLHYQTSYLGTANKTPNFYT